MEYQHCINKKKSSRFKKLLFLFPCLFMLTGCRTFSIIKLIKGKFQYEDTIYLECTGSISHEQCPTGWIKLKDDKKYAFDTDFGFRSDFGIYDTEGTLGLYKNMMLDVYFKLTNEGMSMKIIRDCTGTFEKDAVFLLERIQD